MNQYHISYTITVDCETDEQAYTLADEIVDFIQDHSPAELCISDIHHWALEGDMDNEYDEEGQE